MNCVLGFPSSLELDEITAFVRSLTIRPNERLSRPSRPLVFTMRAVQGSTSWSLDVDPAHQQLVFDQLRAHLPSVKIDQAGTQPASLHRCANHSGTDHADVVGGADVLGLELKLSSHGRLLRSDVAADIAAGLLGVFQGLRNGEMVVVQWLLGPPLPRRVAKPDSTSGEMSLIDQLISPPRLDAEQARALNRKHAEPVFGVVGRIAVAGATRARRWSLAASTLGVLRLSSTPSAHLLPRMITSKRVLRRMRALATPVISWPCTLNAEELACLLGWPVGGPVAAGVTYPGRRELAFPSQLVARSDLVDHRKDQHLRVLGRATHPSRSGLVVQHVRDGLQHTHVIGPTGVGKSTLLTHLAEVDIHAGRGVVVIEPRGDVIADLVDRIPKQRINDVVLLDPSEATRPVGLRLLDGDHSETSVDALVHLLREQFAGSWGPRTQDILMASLTTLARTPGLTLVELPALLADTRFRNRVTAAFRGDVAVGAFWSWFESLSEAERSQVIAPVLNKVRAFTMRASLRRILGQSAPGLHMRDVFTKRRIVLVPLKAGEIGPQMASLLGGLVVSQFWQAAQERTQIAPERRHPVMVYLDEFQTYLRLPTDLADVLAQARGLGVGLTLAHQHLGQLKDSSVRSAVLANARSKVVFHSGIDDAAVLARTLGGGLQPQDLTALGRFEAYARLMADGSSTAPGSLITLPPKPGLGRSGQVRDLSRQHFGANANEIDEAIHQRQSPTNEGARGGRRRRAS